MNIFTETTCEDFDGVRYREFLERNGVRGEGAWRRECLQANTQHKDCPCHIPFGKSTLIFCLSPFKSLGP